MKDEVPVQFRSAPRARVAIVLGCVAVAVTGSTAAAQLVAPAAGRQWATTWSNEFNVGASDLSGFTYDVGNNGWGNNELQNYTAPPGSPPPVQDPYGIGMHTTPPTGTNSANVYVSGGALNISAIATGTGTNQTYTSGRIKTTDLHTQAYGLFEFRARLPAGQGLWPAVWMLPKNNPYGGWPTSGEIDLLESKGQDTGLVQGTLHSGANPGAHQWLTRTFAQSGLRPPGFTTTDWHTYSLEWIPGSANVAATFKWYVDGVNYYTQQGGWYIPPGVPSTNDDAPFDRPFYFLINLAVGGNYVGAPNLSPGTYTMQLDWIRAYTPISSTSPPTWQSVAGGNWSSPGNWANAVIPNSVGAAARFAGAIAQPATVTVDTPITVGGITFDNASHDYTIAGSQTLTLNTTGGAINTTLDVAAGHHAITAPLLFMRNAAVNVSSAQASLRLASASFGSSGSLSLTKSGDGLLEIDKLRLTGSLGIGGGTLRILPNGSNAATSKLASLSIAGTASAPTATLDLSDNDLIIDYTGASGAALIEQVRQWLKSGADTGRGIVSSVTTSSTLLGYADNALLGLGSFGGLSVDSTSILIKFTYAGDATLDGAVDVRDLHRLATGWQSSGVWTSGDFNYDGIVNIADLNLLAGNWQAGSAAALADALSELGLPSVSVPEPATVWLCCTTLAAACLSRASCRPQRRRIP
ncbi:family 16 glycosylhydrolase [Fontivita pretiosa]|uniref:family 16 glycosylhydrolase n=1 Tax=Fontivita pretiosa TaxID=2989684 RepID=UPI003D16E66C